MEQKSLWRQLQGCWGANRRAATPLSLHLCDLAACPPTGLDMGWPPERPPPPTAAGRVRALGWAVGAHDLRVTAHFAPSSIVYLSPDAPEPLRGAPEKGKVYVVGGLVDRSVRRGASLQRAAELGVATARLPLQAR